MPIYRQTPRQHRASVTTGITKVTEWLNVRGVITHSRCPILRDKNIEGTSLKRKSAQLKETIFPSGGSAQLYYLAHWLKPETLELTDVTMTLLRPYYYIISLYFFVCQHVQALSSSDTVHKRLLTNIYIIR